MFKFKVEGLSGAAALLDNAEWPTKAVSLVSPKLNDWKSRGDHHLIVKMDDVGSPELSEAAPTIDHVLTVLTFTSDLTDDDRVLVNCHVGQSRSTAMMIGILVQHGMDPEEAYEAVKEQRPFLLPNLLICQHLDTCLGLPGTLEAISRRHFSPEYLAARRDEMLGKGLGQADFMKDILKRLAAATGEK